MSRGFWKIYIVVWILGATTFVQKVSRFNQNSTKLCFLWGWKYHEDQHTGYFQPNVWLSQKAILLFVVVFPFSRVLWGSAETASLWSEARASRAAAAPCPERPEFRPSLGLKAAPCTHTRVLKSPTSEVTSARIAPIVYIIIVLWLFSAADDLQHCC